MAVHTLVYETEMAIPYTCADNTAIPKGTLVKLSDPMTCAASDGDADIIAGVTKEEKIANDGKTKVPVYEGGYFKATAGGNVTVGKTVMTYSSTVDANDLIDGTNAALYSKCVGIAKETATDGQTFIYKLAPGMASVNLLA